MERAASTPRGGIRPPDLVAVADRRGPYATVWTDRAGAGGWGRTHDDVLAVDLVRGLGDAGAPESVTGHVAAALSAISDDAHGAVVVASEHGVDVIEELAEPPRRNLARWAALPSLAAVLEHRQGDIDVIVVLADRTGADLIVRRQNRELLTTDVEGREKPIRKSAPGGWSQRRFQQRAEETWEHNASAIAERVNELAGRERPELILLGGDVRMVALITDSLPVALRPLARTITGGRAADGSEERREAEIERLIRTEVARETVDLLHAFADQTGARAARGVEDTLEALQRSQVDLLFMHDGGDDERTAFFAAEPGLVAARADDLAAMAATEIESGRLVDVAVNAALRTGATVRVVPEVAAVEGGLAALLRWSDEATGGASGAS